MRPALLLLSVALVFGCGGDLPPLQDTVLSGPAADIASFHGKWFDYEGNLWVVVSASPSPRLSIRAQRDIVLGPATIQNGEIHFGIYYEGASHTSTLRRFEDGYIMLLPPGGQPSGCGTCTPAFSRNRKSLERYKDTLSEVPYFLGSAYDAVMDRLIEVF